MGATEGPVGHNDPVDGMSGEQLAYFLEKIGARPDLFGVCPLTEDLRLAALSAEERDHQLGRAGAIGPVERDGCNRPSGAAVREFLDAMFRLLEFPPGNRKP